MRSQLATEKTRSEGLWEELEDKEKTCEELREELSDLKQKSATAGKEFPEATDLLNQLKAERKKSTATLADIEAILEMIEKSCDDTSQEN